VIVLGFSHRGRGERGGAAAERADDLSVPAADDHHAADRARSVLFWMIDANGVIGASLKRLFD
jgi:hypothetical protein